ncbi:AraC family transcriptional regulator [Kytococcus sedentarius]
MGLADSRQAAPEGSAEPARPLPRGPLPSAGDPSVWASGREAVSSPLGRVVAHRWWVQWAHDGSTPQSPQVLGHPVVHLTVEWGRSLAGDPAPMHGHLSPCILLHGPMRATFSVDLPPEGWVAGIAFHPGAFAAATGIEADRYAAQVVPAADLLGPAASTWLDRVVPHAHREGPAEASATLLDAAASRLRLPGPGEAPGYELVRAACDRMQNQGHRAVADVALDLHVSVRTLQREFRRLVGLSPLVVLRRYRLQEAAARLEEGGAPDLASLAADLGFSDHAHLTREFTAAVGLTPSAYRDRVARARAVHARA